MAVPLVTAQEVSDWTEGKVLATDPRLPDLIAGATAAIRRYCGWHIAPQTSESLLLDGPDGDLLVLPTMYLTAVSSVTELGAALTEYDHAAGTGDYEWSVNGEIRRTSGCWTYRYRAIVAEITHGFDSAPDVAQIIKQVVSAALSSPMGATREQAGALAVTWASTGVGISGGLSLLERDLATLNTYRLPARA